MISPETSVCEKKPLSDEEKLTGKKNRNSFLLYKREGSTANLAFCHENKGLLKKMGLSSNDWCLFIDRSKQRLKCMGILNRNENSI